MQRLNCHSIMILLCTVLNNHWHQPGYETQVALTVLRLLQNLALRPSTDTLIFSQGLEDGASMWAWLQWMAVWCCFASSTAAVQVEQYHSKNKKTGPDDCWHHGITLYTVCGLIMQRCSLGFYSSCRMTPPRTHTKKNCYLCTLRDSFDRRSQPISETPAVLMPMIIR